MKVFSTDEYVALNRHVSDIKSDLYQIVRLLETRLGAENSLSQEAARALSSVESLNTGLLRNSEKTARSAVNDAA